MSSFPDLQLRDQTTQIAHALCRRVDHYFQHQTPRDQQISIRVEPLDVVPLMDGRAQRCDLRFVLTNGARVSGSLLTRYLGGNMYEIDASVGERVRRFTLCLPQPTIATDDTSGHKVCDYLFDEIKRSAGELFLKEISLTCRPGCELR